MKAAGVLLALAMTTLFASAQPHPFAEAIDYHGNILTGVDLETEHPQRVEALAMAHGEILAVGSDADILARYKGPATQMTDLHGAFVMPGFNDAHTHLGMGGRILTSVDLIGVRSLREMQVRIRAAAEKAAPGQWLTGGGWDQTLWPDGKLPTRKDIDAVALGHPAIFTRVDGHIAVADSAALMTAGVTRATRDPEGGAIDHETDGEPMGILRETAQSLVKAPPPSPEQRRRGLELALENAVAHGVTTVQDFSDWDDYLMFEQLEKGGPLPVRVAEWIPFDEPVALEKQQAAQQAKSDRMLHTTMLKGFLDGSLGSRTAALNAPYADDAGNVGLPRYTQDKLNAMTVERAEAGFQIGFHAIGDHAVNMALNAFAAAEAALQRNGLYIPPQVVNPEVGVRRAIIVPWHDIRYRIEHSQVVDAGDFARYKQLRVIASMQPAQLLTDMAWAEQRLGPERSRYAYAWKSFLDAGVALAFGTDYPIEPITPLRGVYAAVTRRNEAGTVSFHPEQKLTISQALYAYTQGSAYAEYADGWKGKLAPGYVADFVVLDRDLTAVAPHAILGAKVLRTVVDGKTVYAQ